MAPASSCGLICMQPQGPHGAPCAARTERWNPLVLLPTFIQSPKLAVLQAIEETPPESSPDVKQLRDIIEDLPIEIACRIFEHSTRSNNAEWPHDLPFKLGSICTRWRQIAWSTPSLWTHILFSIESTNLSHRIDLLEEIIPRSRTLPITLKLTGVGFFDGKSHPPESFKTSDDFRRFTRCLYECSGRWYNLDIKLFDMSYIILLFQLLPHAPNLQNLHILLFIASVDSSMGDDSPAINIDLASLAPNIQKFHLGHHPNLSALSIRWDTIIDLGLGGDVLEVVAATQKAPLLRRLSVINRRPEEPAALQSQSQPLFTHTNLRSVQFEDAYHAIMFFNSMAVPNLEDLTLNSGDLSGISLAAALERSCRGCAFTKLYLYNVEMGDSVQSSYGILAVFGVLPSLTELELSYQHSQGRAEEYCGAVFRTFGSENRALLPKLQVFHLEAASEGREDFAFIVSAFGHIQRFSVPLLELSITFQIHHRQSWIDALAVTKPNSLDKALLRQIQALRMEGRAIRVVMQHGLSQIRDFAPDFEVV